MIEKFEWKGGSARYVDICINDSFEFCSINRELANELNIFLNSVHSVTNNQIRKQSIEDINKEEKYSCARIAVRSKRKAARLAMEATKMDLQNDELDNDSDSSTEYQLGKSLSDQEDSSSSSDSDDEGENDSTASTVSVDTNEDVKKPAKTTINSSTIDHDNVQKRAKKKSKSESPTTDKIKSIHRHIEDTVIGEIEETAKKNAVLKPSGIMNYFSKKKK